MSDLTHLDRFILELRDAPDIEGAFGCLGRAVERMGFQYHTYELLRPPSGIGPSLYTTTYPKDWIARYIEKGYGRDDTVCQILPTKLLPFLWTDATRSPRLSARQAAIVNESRDAGIWAGASIPVHGPGNARAYVAVADRTSDDEFARRFARYRYELQLIAIYTHEKVIDVAVPAAGATPTRLTPRETEIMAWTARGKTAWEISEILAVSHQTVKDHIERVCRKLDVNDKTHATALALLRGYIAL